MWYRWTVASFFPSGSSVGWKELLDLADPQEYGPEHILFRHDSPAHDIYLVESGFVNLTVFDPLNAVENPVSWRSSGQLLGECAVILGVPYPVTAKTGSRCTIYRIPARRFLEALRPDPESALWSLAQSQCRDILTLVRGTVLSSSNQARKRLEYMLWQLAVQQAGSVENSETKLTGYSPGNKELAGYVGVNPTYISRLLSDLHKDHLAHREGSLIVVSQPQKLFHPAERQVNTAEAVLRWKRLLGLSMPRHVEPASVLFREQERVEELYLIEKGFVDVSVTTKKRAKRVERSLLWRGAGQIVGYWPVFLDTLSPVTVRTETDCLLHRIPASHFMDILLSDRSAPLWRLATVENVDMLNFLANVSVSQSQPLRNRLEYVLWQLAKQQSRGEPKREIRLAEFSPSNETLAGYIGTEQRYITDLMHDLKKDHLAWRGTDRILTVHNPQRLFHPIPGLTSV